MTTAAILGVGGLGFIRPKLIDGLKAWRSGKARREKVENKSLLQRLISAETRADFEAAFRRALQEHVGILRVMLVNMGYPRKDLPHVPERKDIETTVK